MSLSLELEIKSLLQAQEEPELVADELIRLFEDQRIEWTEEVLTELYRFLWACGLFRQLVQFCLKHLSDPGFKIPWTFFIEALHRGQAELTPELVDFISRGISEEKAEEAVALAKGGDRFIQESHHWRSEYKRKRLQNLSILKEQALDELLTLRTQQLYEQEKRLLTKLRRQFPDDEQILQEIRNHKERYAFELLSRKSPLRRRLHFAETPDPELLKGQQGLQASLNDNSQLHPEMTFDFAIAAFMVDDYETSLQLLESMSALSEAQLWFKMDVLLHCRRFLEVLQGLTILETTLAHNPETFFATAYLRAQAYWGLDQKHVALEILENLLFARPNYRAGTALLDQWRQL